MSSHGTRRGRFTIIRFDFEDPPRGACQFEKQSECPIPLGL
jgi:hypothetical protein